MSTTPLVFIAFREGGEVWIVIREGAGTRVQRIGPSQAAYLLLRARREKLRSPAIRRAGSRLRSRLPSLFVGRRPRYVLAAACRQEEEELVDAARAGRPRREGGPL